MTSAMDNDTCLITTASQPDRDASPYLDPPAYTEQDLSKLSILLMGATGVGKSCFAATITRAAVRIGDSLHPCTTECEGWDFTYRPGLVVSLVDTPGFNDLERPDMEVLGTIVEYIQTKACGRIAGIIYLHRITDKRVTGSSRMNLRMLQTMCGDHFFQNVMLTSTMWGSVAEHVIPDLETREAELNGSDVFWGGMLEKGSKYLRYNNNRASGMEIIDTCLAQRNAPPMNIVLELRRGLSLEDTSAGKILTEELRKREDMCRQELLEEQEEERQYLQQTKAQKEAELRAMEQSMQRREEQAPGSKRHHRLENRQIAARFQDNRLRDREGEHWLNGEGRVDERAGGHLRRQEGESRRTGNETWSIFGLFRHR